MLVLVLVRWMFVVCCMWLYWLILGGSGLYCWWLSLWCSILSCVCVLVCLMLCWICLSMVWMWLFVVVFWLICDWFCGGWC